MKLVLAFGSGGGGYYPFTQKPVDYQPYRPIYLYRGPPPDAGFSYGVFEDEESQKLYYADMGLEPYSPFSGKPSKLLKEVEFKDMERDLKKDDKLDEVSCEHCGASYVQNFGKHLKGRDQYYCHRCGGQL